MRVSARGQVSAIRGVCCD